MGEKIHFGSVQMTVVSGWRDATSELEMPVRVFTITKGESGVGALQFSIARYVAGQRPDPSGDTLLRMAKGTGKAHHLGEPRDEVVEDGRLRLGAVSYSGARDFTRIWYVSDGESIAMITYTCEAGSESFELQECEGIVRTLEFCVE